MLGCMMSDEEDNLLDNSTELCGSMMLIALRGSQCAISLPWLEKENVIQGNAAMISVLSDCSDRGSGNVVP